jgi:hypothetical protein
MRNLAFAFSIVAAVTVAAPRAASAAEPKSPWEGFGAGSYVHQKTSSTMSGIPNMPSMPPQESESKMTLVKVTDDAWTVKMETKVGGSWQANEMVIPRKAPPGTEPKVEDLGTEMLTIDGQSLSCRKQKVVVAGTESLTWTNAEHGAVKSESTVAGQRVSTVVTKLAGKTTVAGTEVPYQERVTTMTSPAGDTTTTQWSSSAVLGGVLRSEMTTAMPGGMTTKVVTETIAFEKK